MSDVSVPSFSTSVNESEDSFSNLRLLLSLCTLKMLKMSKLNQCNSMRHLLISIFCQQMRFGCAKYTLPFLKVILEVEAL